MAIRSAPNKQVFPGAPAGSSRLSARQGGKAVHYPIHVTRKRPAGVLGIVSPRDPIRSSRRGHLYRQPRPAGGAAPNGSGWSHRSCTWSRPQPALGLPRLPVAALGMAALANVLNNRPRRRWPPPSAWRPGAWHRAQRSGCRGDRGRQSGPELDDDWLAGHHAVAGADAATRRRGIHARVFAGGRRDDGARTPRCRGRAVDSSAGDWRRVSPLRVLLCVDGAAPDALLEATLPLLTQAAVWVPTHVVDARGRRDLGFLRSGIPGSGPLSRSQQEVINAATAEHTRATLEMAEASLRSRGLAQEPPQIRVGEPGREICAVAAAVGAGLVVLFASRRARAASGPGQSATRRASCSITPRVPCCSCAPIRRASRFWVASRCRASAPAAGAASWRSRDPLTGRC